MIISIFGMERNSGQTIANVLLSYVITKHTEHQVLMLSAGKSLYDYQDLFGFRIDNSIMKSPAQLINLIRAKQVKKDELDDYSIILERNLTYIPTELTDVKSRTDIAIIPDIIRLEDEKIIMVDINLEPSHPEAQLILEKSDIIIYSINQTLAGIYNFNEWIAMHEEWRYKILPLVNKYDPIATPYRYIADQINIKPKLALTLPYSPWILQKTVMNKFDQILDWYDANDERIIEVISALNNNVKNILSHLLLLNTWKD